MNWRNLDKAVSFIIIIIIIIIISFMQGTSTHIPETNYVPREHGVAAILLFLFMVLYRYLQCWIYCTFTLVLSEECVQCPVWLIIIIIIVIIIWNWVLNRWQWLFYTCTKYEIGY